MLSKLVKGRLKGLSKFDQVNLSQTIETCSSLKPDEEFYLFLTFLSGLEEKYKNDTNVLTLMGELLGSFLVFTNPSSEDCKKLSKLVGPLIIDDSLFSKKLNEIQKDLSERINLQDSELPNFKSKILKNKVTLNACIQFVRSLNAVQVPIKKEYVDIMVKKLQSVLPEKLEKNPIFRKNYLILINEIKKSNYEEYRKILNTLAKETILKQIGSADARAQFDNEMMLIRMAIQKIVKELSELELSKDIERNIALLETNGESVNELKEELNLYKKLLSDCKKKVKDQTNQYRESIAKVYSGEDLSDFEKLGESLIEDSRKALELNRSSYEGIKEVITDFSNKVAALFKNAQEKSKKIDQEYNKAVKQYKAFFSGKDNALTQLQLLQLQKQNVFQSLKLNQIFSSDNLQKALDIFDKIEGISKSFEEARAEKKSLLENPLEKKLKIKSISDNISSLSAQLNIKETLNNLETLLVQVGEELDTEVTNLKKKQADLTREVDAKTETIQTNRKELETHNTEIEKLQKTQNSEWKTIQESYIEQCTKISILKDDFSSTIKENNNSINELNIPIWILNLPIIRFFFSEELKELKEKKAELEQNNETLMEIIPILTSVKNDGIYICIKDKKDKIESETKSYNDSFTKLEDFAKKHSINLELRHIETSKYLKNNERLNKLTIEQDELVDQIETTTKSQKDLEAKVAEEQKKIDTIESHKNKNLEEILKQKHGTEGLIDLNKPENTEFARLLRLSAQTGDLVQIQHILNHCKNFNIQNDKGNNALHLAAANGQVSVVRLLLPKEEWHSPNKEGNTPLHLAIKKGNPEIVGMLLQDLKSNNVEWNSPNKNGNTLLHLAVSSGNPAVVNLLLEELKKNDLGTPNKYERTPLFLAYKKYTEEQDPTKKESFNSIIQNLRKSGAEFNIEEHDSLGNSIFHMAAKNGHIQLIQDLIKDKTFFTRITQFIKNPLDEKNKEGKTPLQLALENNHNKVVRLLLNEGAAIDKQIFSTEQGKKFLAELPTTDKLHAKFVTSLPEQTVETPTVIEQSKETQELLRKVTTIEEAEARIKEIGSRDFTDESTRNEWIKEIETSAFKQKFQLANEKDKNGNTLFHVLVQQQDQEAINKLVMYANVYIKNINNQSVVELAKKYMHEKSGSVSWAFESMVGDKKLEDTKEFQIFKKITERAEAQNRSQLRLIQMINTTINQEFNQELVKHKHLSAQLMLKKVDVRNYMERIHTIENKVAAITREMNRTKDKDNNIKQPLEQHVIEATANKLNGLINVLKEDIKNMKKMVEDIDRYEWHNKDEDKALHKHIKNGDLSSWQSGRDTLLKETINKPSGGYTPLQLAIAYGNSNDSEEDQEKSFKMAKFLIEKGADINAQNSKGETALHLLANRKDNAGKKIMELLKNRSSVDTDIKDNNGKTARDIAETGKNTNFLTLFPTILKVYANNIADTFFTDKKDKQPSSPVEKVEEESQNDGPPTVNHMAEFRKNRRGNKTRAAGDQPENPTNSI